MYFYSYFDHFFAITMKLVCNQCKFFREENGKNYCWITEKTVAKDTPICDFNFQVKADK